MLWRALAVTVAVCTGPIGVSAQCAAGSGIGDDGNCVLCVRGRYGNGNSCEVCQKGTYDHDGSAATACALCGAGTYSGAAAFACIPCVAGTHDDDADAATVCVACDNGKYSPAASYTDENTVGCEDCAAGRADLDGPATPCTDCAEGKYSAQGATHCSACAPGQYDHDYTAKCVETAAFGWGLSVLADALACEAVTDLSTEAACVAVMQDADATAGACSYIAAVALSARTRCVQCGVGTYAPAGSTSCFRCPAGHHDVDMNPATPCDQDSDLCVSVDSDASADTCLGDGVLDGTTAENEDECEGRGTECNFLVSSSCPAGTHTNGVFGQIVCTPCDAGTYDHDMAPETACQPCPAGTYADTGQSSCTACVAGQVDEDSNPASHCTTCGTGKYSPEGETECTDCIAGRADLDTNSATPCDSCGSGQHSDAGVTVCTDCARGTYNDQGPAKKCKECGVGFYSDVAATSCSPGADCVGTWTTCTAACETSAARAFIIITAQAGGGAACPTAAPDCADGDGACIGTFHPPRALSPCRRHSSLRVLASAPALGAAARGPVPPRGCLLLLLVRLRSLLLLLVRSPLLLLLLPRKLLTVLTKSCCIRA